MRFAPGTGRLSRRAHATGRVETDVMRPALRRGRTTGIGLPLPVLPRAPLIAPGTVVAGDLLAIGPVAS